MIRLSAKGWNNVLIFSTLFMILLFNGVHKKLMDGHDQQTVTVLPYQSSVLTFDVANQLTLTRVGPSFQSSDERLSAAQTAELMQVWSQLSGMVSVPVSTDIQGYVVTIELAGIEQPMVVELVQADQLWLHDYAQGRWLNLYPVTIQDVLPSILLATTTAP